MSKPTAQDLIAILEGVFADVLGFTRDDWATIEEYIEKISSTGLFDSHTVKCTVAAFVLWYEFEGYQSDDRRPNIFPQG